jgi:hypothetical protein
MQCKELEAVLESEGLSPLPPEAREHLASCTSCQDFLADLSAVVVAAKRLPAEMTPPDRIWVSIRAQLETEGIIRDTEPVAAAVATTWWSGFADLFRPRVLATVGAGLLVVFGSIYIVEHRSPDTVAPTPQPIQTQTQTNQTQNAPPPAPTPLQPAQVVATKNAPQVARSPQPVNPTPRPAVDNLRPSPSENMYFGNTAGVLSQTEDSLSNREMGNDPTVDTALRENLRTLNEFIAECESRLKQNPQDQLTREYLNMAYQQKAELLNAMMDTGRSEH